MSSYKQGAHKEAYLIWRATKKWSEVCSRIGCTPVTARAWSQADYKCREGCPWHGWKELEYADLQKRSGQISLNPPDADLPAVPTADHQPVAVKHALSVRERRELIAANTRSDLARIGDLEYLYAKLYHDLTGLPIECPVVRDANGNPKSPEELKSVYGFGLKPVNIESGIRALVQILDQIQRMKRDSGVYDKPSSEEGNEPPRELTLEEARKINEALENTPPDKVQAIVNEIRSEKRGDGTAKAAGTPQNP